MVKKIMSVFGYKVFDSGEYRELLNSIASCGNYYRVLSKDSEYHHGNATVAVPLSELGKICLVENCVWEDIKDRIYKA